MKKKSNSSRSSNKAVTASFPEATGFKFSGKNTDKKGKND